MKMAPPECANLTFKDCELAILRLAVDQVERTENLKLVNSPQMKRIFAVANKFVKDHQLIMYGGTAINNILPKTDQFYKDSDLPDIDVFSPDALNHAKQLADTYHRAGFKEVEAKSGQHHGTYKVFVNFVPVMDLTFIHPQIFRALRQDAVVKDGQLYTPPNFLRMAMYLELSRPKGDTSRWEKILKRLILLNKHYPLEGKNCGTTDIQRSFSTVRANEHELARVARAQLAKDKVVFFGGFACRVYSEYMPAKHKRVFHSLADFDVLSETPKATAERVRDAVDRARKQWLVDRPGAEQDITVSVVEHEAVGELVPTHYEVRVNDDAFLFVYAPVGCHSYNAITVGGVLLRIATIDTILSFYLAFMFANQSYYNQFLNRTMCIAQFLFELQKSNRLSQRGVLRRFSTTCYGHQVTREEMRAEKMAKFEELRGADRGHDADKKREYEEWFLNYRPAAKAAPRRRGSAAQSRRAAPRRARASTAVTRRRTSSPRGARSGVAKWLGLGGHHPSTPSV